MASSYEEEMLDLVDKDNQVVGTISHEQAFDTANLDGNYLRAANAYIMNSKGELWVPVRSPHKRFAPNGLDYSAAEHMEAGESYIDAMVRGFDEELQMKVKPAELELVGTTTPRAAHPYFAAVYIYYSDEVPDYNKDDFASYEWLTPTELKTKLESGIPAKDSLTDSLELLASYMGQHQSHN
jgi:isopentenyl-diphosphate delta-isomerase